METLPILIVKILTITICFTFVILTSGGTNVRSTIDKRFEAIVVNIASNALDIGTCLNQGSTNWSTSKPVIGSKNPDLNAASCLITTATVDEVIRVVIARFWTVASPWRPIRWDGTFRMANTLSSSSESERIRWDMSVESTWAPVNQIRFEQKNQVGNDWVFFYQRNLWFLVR